MNPRFYLSLVLFLLAACDAGETRQAAADSQQTQNNTSQTSPGMVATANPLATDAGVAVLEAGGSAADAAVAIEAVLSLVEPQSSGLGGGGFMLHYNNETKNIDVYDGRETAPMGATAEMFLQADGTPMSFMDAKTSGLSIGVPGMISLLSLAHQDHGVLPWNALFTAATDHAIKGFEVSPRLHNYLVNFREYIPDTPDEGPIDAYTYFYMPDGSPKEVLINSEYAETLKRIGQNPRALYEGELAEEIAAKANVAPRPGSLTASDLSNYSARKLEPLCSGYRDLTLCGPPPPSSWVAVGMVMGMLESAPRFTSESPPLRDWTVVAEALRLAYADRDAYVADDDFVSVPLAGLLHPDYLANRAAEIDAEKSATSVKPGDPWAFEAEAAAQYGIDATMDMAGTTHFAVVDAKGNAVAMTASVESLFGSTRMAGGMILNNQLTDFSRVPRDQTGTPIANAVEPLKRPRSSMSPTIVLNADGEFLMSTGSPGGNSIISYTVKTLVGVLDWGLSPQEAVDLPNMVARGDTVRIENSRASEALIRTLKDYGLQIRESAGENSGLSLISRRPDGSLEGGVDPRREGTIGIPSHQSNQRSEPQ